MSESGYYRHPSIHRDTIVFVCEDDLWTVSAEGGTARRLTANPGRALWPALSPDGELLAYVGYDEGTPEVFCMPATGGEARRPPDPHLLRRPHPGTGVTPEADEFRNMMTRESPRWIWRNARDVS